MFAYERSQSRPLVLRDAALHVEREPIVTCSWTTADQFATYVARAAESLKLKGTEVVCPGQRDSAPGLPLHTSHPTQAATTRTPRACA